MVVLFDRKEVYEQKMEFNKSQYDMEYRKKYKKQFSVDLNIDEHEEITNFLKAKNITKVKFVRDAFKELKEKEERKK